MSKQVCRGVLPKALCGETRLEEYCPFYLKHGLTILCLNLYVCPFLAAVVSREHKRRTYFEMQRKGVGEGYLQSRGGVSYSCSWAFLPFSQSPDKIPSSRHDIILPVSHTGPDVISPSDRKLESLCSRQTLITAKQSLLPVKQTQAWDKQVIFCE